MTTIKPAPLVVTVPRLRRLLRAERRKLTTTKTWWQFAVGVAATTGLGLLLSVGTTDDALHHGGKGAPAHGFADVSAAPAHLVAPFAADVFTSGQYFGAMFATLLAVLMITGEYRYQTATTTFLASPRRTAVIVSKFLMAMIAATAVWGLSTAIDLAVGVTYFSSQGLSSQLGSWTVERAILTNLMVFALWGVLGLGIGVLSRSQTAAVVITVMLYTVGLYGAQGVIAAVQRFVYHHDSVVAWIVLYPGYAAQVAADPHSTNLPDNSISWWVGALVMLGYGLVMATIGTTVLRRRDIS